MASSSGPARRSTMAWPGCARRYRRHRRRLPAPRRWEPVGQHGPSLRPVLPGVVGAAVLVEELGGHLGAPGGCGRAAQGQLPVPVCRAVTGTGGVGGPSVERDRHRLGRAVSFGCAPGARRSGRGAVRAPRRARCGPAVMPAPAPGRGAGGLQRIGLTSATNGRVMPRGVSGIGWATQAFGAGHRLELVRPERGEWTKPNAMWMP